MSAFQRILVATDFSPSSWRALDAAVTMAQMQDAELLLLHVVEPAPYPSPAPFPYPLPVTAVNRAAVQKQLEEWSGWVHARWPRSEALLRDGTPWEEIVATAKERGADLIVIGSQGLRGLPRWLLGSVAERVVRLSPLPVLTVHGYCFDDRVQAGRELGRALASERDRVPAVIAISPGGLVVAYEVAKTLGTTPDILMTGIVWKGTTLLGGVCEDGTTRAAPQAIGAVVAAEEHGHLISQQRESLRREAMRIRGPRWIEDFQDRTVILVSDDIAEPWTVLAAADVVSKAGATRVLAAAPVGSISAVDTLRREIGNVVVLEMQGAGREAAGPYRNHKVPSDRVLSEYLTP